jgi:hypothetical protein
MHASGKVLSMVQPERQADRIRKLYTRPAITEVALRPEEAVLGACKSSVSVGSSQASSCTSPLICVVIGS